MRWGFWRDFDKAGVIVAAIYLAIAASVYAVTAATTKPEKMGMDWIPFVALAGPWVRVHMWLFLAGVPAECLGAVLMWRDRSLGVAVAR